MPKYPGNLPVKEWPQVRALRAVFMSNALLRDLHKGLLASLGLSLSEFDLIAALGNTQGMRMTDIAMHMISSASNITRLCAALEKRGLVKRQRSRESDREVLAKLTPAGEKLFQSTFQKVPNYTRQIMDSGLTLSEQKQLTALLDKLMDKATAPEE